MALVSCARFPPFLAVLLLSSLPCDAQNPKAVDKRFGKLIVPERPLRFEGSDILFHVRAGGSAVVRLGVDSSGHVDRDRNVVKSSTDSALGELALEIARSVVFDSLSVLRLSRNEQLDVPFVFLLDEIDTGTISLSGSEWVGSALTYVLVRPDSTSPLTAEALVDAPERVGGPPPDYPVGLMNLGVEGTVMIASANSGFNSSAQLVVRLSRFQVARTPWRALRARLRIPVTYTIRH